VSRFSTFGWFKAVSRSLSGPPKSVRRGPGRRPARCTPRLEALEARLTPNTYTVTDASDTVGSATDVTLRYAISQAVLLQDQNAVIGFSNALAGQVINLSIHNFDNSYGPTAFVVRNAHLTIDGSNAPRLSLSGGNALRLFAVTNTAELTLKNLTVTAGSAQGGDGGHSFGGGGGGGGAGLGGAVYNDGGNFTAEGVTFVGNHAGGGRGGDLVFAYFSDTGGGGGALGVAGGNGESGGGRWR
jgi:hypothetical protein